MRAKLLFLIIVYFAGFATAVYCMGPAPAAQDGRQVAENPEFDTEEFVASLNIGMHKCIDFGKEAALQTAEIIKEKVKEAQTPPDS